MQHLINEIADMIAKYDNGAARIFRSQPFHRETILRAFFRSCEGTSLEDIAFRIVVLGNEVIKLERAA